MSEDVRYKGELTPIKFKNNEKTSEDVCKRLCEENGIDSLDIFYNSWGRTIIK